MSDNKFTKEALEKAMGLDILTNTLIGWMSLLWKSGIKIYTIAQLKDFLKEDFTTGPKKMQLLEGKGVVTLVPDELKDLSASMLIHTMLSFFVDKKEETQVDNFLSAIENVSKTLDELEQNKNRLH